MINMFDYMMMMIRETSLRIKNENKKLKKLPARPCRLGMF